LSDHNKAPRAIQTLD